MSTSFLLSLLNIRGISVPEDLSRQAYSLCGRISKEHSSGHGLSLLRSTAPTKLGCQVFLSPTLAGPCAEES